MSSPATMPSMASLGDLSQIVVATPEMAQELSEVIIALELHRYDAVLQAIAAGVTSVVPRHMLRILHWRDVRRLVCGDAVVSEEGLKQFVQVNVPPPHDQWLWQAFRKMAPEDRSLFLYFATGQRRLPLKSPIRVQFKRRSTQESAELPTAATCFFTMTLPEYSSPAVLYERLVYAIRHCHAIDGDGNARERVVMND